MKALLILLLLASNAHAVQQHGLVNGALPTAVANGSQVQVRMSKYGETLVVPVTTGNNYIANEEQYFTAMTATPGTAYALSGATQTAFVATTPTFFIKNNAGAGGKRVFIDSLRLSLITAGTGITSVHYAIAIDTGARTTSAGTALTVSNPFSGATTATITTGVVGGAVTASAATSVRYIYRGTLKNAAPVIGDAYTINFGSLDSGAATHLSAVGPAILDGGHTLLVYVWFTGSTAAPTGEISAAWFER